MPTEQKGERLGIAQKLFYSFGHYANDITINCWFAYLIFYFTNVVGLSNTQSGMVVLVGQTADSMCTFFIGYFFDKLNCSFYGRRKSWHVIGTVMVLLSFPFLFNGFSGLSPRALTIYYCFLSFVFSVGWCLTQISHLALIPVIGHTKNDQVTLNAYRACATFLAGISAYSLSWMLLGLTEVNDVQSLRNTFAILSGIVVGLGFVLSLLFHIGIEEPKTDKRSGYSCCVGKFCCFKREKTTHEKPLVNEKEELPDPNTSTKKAWKEWLLDGKLYKTTVLYFCSRVGVNIFQSFFTLYLSDVLNFQKEAIAYFPLIVLISGVISSYLCAFITRKIGCQMAYVLGATMVSGAGVWIFVATVETRNTVYGAASVAGCGMSIILVSAYARITKYVARKKKNGTYAYSIIMFPAKFGTGVAIYLLQYLKPIPEINRTSCDSCVSYSKIVQACVPTGMFLFGAILLLAFFPYKTSLFKKKYAENLLPFTDTKLAANPINSPRNFYKARLQRDGFISPLPPLKLVQHTEIMNVVRCNYN